MVVYLNYMTIAYEAEKMDFVIEKPQRIVKEPTTSPSRRRGTPTQYGPACTIHTPAGDTDLPLPARHRMSIRRRLRLVIDSKNVYEAHLKKLSQMLS